MTGDDAADQRRHRRWPLLSVVLAVGRVERFLPGCLDSVARASRTRPAGPRSSRSTTPRPDGCGRILDARGAADPATAGHPPDPQHRSRAGPDARAGGGHRRVRVVRRPGRSAHRGSLAAVAARLARDGPDVLLLDYRIAASVRPDRAKRGRRAAGRGRRAWSRSRTGRPWSNRTMTLWSKVFRRPFLGELGVTLRPGIHEDVPLSAGALLAARRIAALDRVCYLYRRQARLAAGHGQPGPFRHLRVLRGGFRAAGRRGPGAGHPGGPGGGVRPRRLEHYSSILANGLVPRGRAEAILRPDGGRLPALPPAGVSRPGRLRGLKTGLICGDAYRAYALLAPVNNARVTARRARRGPADQRRTRPPAASAAADRAHLAISPHITNRSRRVFAAVTEQSGDEGLMRKCDTSSGSSWR